MRQGEPKTRADGASLVPVIDGHNDVLARAFENARYDFVEGTESYHLDLPGALESGFAGGLFAIFIPPSEKETKKPRSFGDKLSTPGRVPLERAQRAAALMFSQLRRYAERAHGRFYIARSVGDLRRSLHGNAVAALCHMEGAEAIDSDLAALDLFYEAGLRSLGITWSRSNRFGTGVPFGFDRDPDIGPGLTKAGRDLVRRCNELGIMLDVSHLNAGGFRDLARTTRAPIVASHSNAWGVSKSTRNLTDEQLAAIRDSDGLVGVNFGVPFLRSDGGTGEDTPLTVFRKHIEYLAERIGIERIGLGSDFDGVVIPREIGSVRGLPRLIAALREWGYSEEEITGIAHRNWLRVLGQTLK
ncbi:MAG: dipeptidase [Spirochaetaceae bacterium]